jgi:undecaprenyl-diphosphatase
MSNIWLVALLLGIVEGFTEYLPISSTGHLIIASRALGFRGEMANDFAIFIQFGAILAVLVLYRERLWGLLRDLPRDPQAQRLAGGVLVAFLPIAVLGLLAHRWITRVLFHPPVVAAALIAGGIAILIIERVRPSPRVHELESIGWRTMAGIGLIQCLALVPGVSRSGATILGGVCLGLDNKTATEFSFFVAIPILAGATLYDLTKAWPVLTHGQVMVFMFGMAVSAVVAGLVIAALLRFVQTHSFNAFAYYRIALGVIVLFFARQGFFD